MTWDHPSHYQWCTRNGRIVIERAFYREGFEIRRRVNRGDYRWVRDDARDVRVFKTLLQAKAFAREELIAVPSAFVARLESRRAA